MNTLLAIQIDFTTMLPYMNYFIEGAWMTLKLSMITVLLGCVIGFVATLGKRSKYKIFNLLATLYTQIIRGTPILLQLMLIRYGLPAIGVPIPAIPYLDPDGKLTGCVLALGINSGAYVCEIFRAGLDSIDKGQTEAARSLGLDAKQTMRFVILPQAIKTILPTLGNEFIMMIKESSLVSTLGIFDVMYTQKIIQSLTYRQFEPLIVIAVIYLIMTTTLTGLLGILERKLNNA
ncbi:MAG: amino acid ABC transporter permease [Erysipelotrichaceae bacterium]|nr:amino acid ABC transporter permease [Erysipelotrichaceae bacterium]MBR3693670.1 amino acid ABC transporter permease [Erysipelotrichales bacterium]